METYRHTILESIKKKVNWFIEQYEGGTHDMKHIQLMFGFKNPRTLGLITRLLQNENVQILVDAEKCIKYCTYETKRDPDGELYVQFLTELMSPPLNTKYIPQTPHNQSALLNGSKTYQPNAMYKCARCKFRTKYKGDLKDHAQQHYTVKMYKCSICYRRFKTRESFKQHEEKTHIDSDDTHSGLCRVGRRPTIDTYSGFADGPAGLHNESVYPSDQMDDDLKYLTLLGLLYLLWKRRSKKNRRMWVHPIVNDRLTKGHFYTLFAEVREDEEKFFNFTRMSMASFKELLGCIKEKVTKKNTRMRSCIPPEEKLVITLRYLASGCSLTELHYTFRVGRSTTSCIIKEVCEAIWLSLAESAIPPLTTQKFLDIAAGFEKYAKFPNVIGAIGGKHIQHKQPPNSGSIYFNYKGDFSTVLLAMCDTNYCFTYVEVGSYAKSSDTGIFNNSKLFDKLRSNSLGIPPPRFLPNSPEKFPYVILGDEAFPLSENLLRPYGGKPLAEDKQIFNNRLSIARQYIECTFGILADKWRIFHRPSDVDIDFADSIVKAACVLHNFVRRRDGTREESFRDTNVPQSHSMQSLQPHTHNRSNYRSLSARDKYASYFSRE